MVRPKSVRECHTLLYDDEELDPEDLLTFVETKQFSRAWERIGLTDEDLRALQVLLMANPMGAPVVPGTAGLRKLRFSAPKLARGKRDAVCVCYAYFETNSVILLILAYAKSRKDDLSVDEKRAIRQLILIARQELEE